MPVHFEIEYSGSVPLECVANNPSYPLAVNTSYPDVFNRDVSGTSEEITIVTVIFTKDRSGSYPQDVTVFCSASAHVYVDSPTGSSTHSSNVSIINRSGQDCDIRITCTSGNSVEEWLFENSYCVDETGQPVSCPPGVTPTQMRIKVKRQPVYEPPC